MQADPAFVKTVEIEYLRTLSQFLKRGSIDRALAKSSAQMFLTFLPFVSLDDMKAKIDQFAASYPALEPFHLQFLCLLDEKATQETLEKMRVHMKTNNIDAALQLVQK